jgi:predicted nucleic acid-binding protein
MISWRTVTIRPRSHATRYDGFMLDTAISSYIIKRRPATLVERFEEHAESLSVSVMTAAELRFGAAKAGRPKLAELVEAYLAGSTSPSSAKTRSGRDSRRDAKSLDGRDAARGRRMYIWATQVVADRCHQSR